MRTWHRLALFGMVLGASLVAVAPAHAFDWASLWSTAEQRAARQFEKQQYDELINNAPDANWRGLGEYRNGDYTAAAKSFEQQREQLRGQGEQAGITTEIDRALYNQANAHVFEENYPAAIGLYDEILESDPQHTNAKHNRDIAQQLLEQQQQEQQEQSGEQGEQSDENQSDSDSEQDQEGQEGQQDQQQDQQSGEDEQSDSQNSEQGEEQEQDDQSSEQQSNSSSQGSDSDTEEASTAEEQAEQDAAAEAAMQAERERQADEQQAENAQAAESSEPVAPLSEREQANEQWLRQIPDDPAGLLERKIHNRHQTDFPKVLDSDKPW